MWGDLQKAETHHDAVILVARVIAQTKPYHMSRFIMGLLPPPNHPPSSTVLAFYTELLCYPELLEKSQQKLIIQMMLRAKPTGKDVEILRIRALWNVCSHIPDKVKKYKKEMQAIIKAGLHNMDTDIVLEAMKTAGQMAILLEKKDMGTLYHDALVQIEAFKNYVKSSRGIILEAMTKDQITSDIFPKIACMLLHQIARNIQKDEASAIRTSASALKKLLMQGLAEQDALILENSNMWGDLQKAETHHDAVIRVARVIAKTKPYHMSRFIMGLLPPPYHPPSSTVLAFYTELLCYPELLEKSQQKLIIQMMLRAKPTGKDVEILRIRALWNVCSHIPDKVKKYKKEMQAIIKAGLHNMDTDIVLEAMKTAGQMAILLEKKDMGTLYHDALVQIEAFKNYVKSSRGIILEAMTKDQITSDIFPKIACMLLHQIARNIQKDEASAIRTSASALKKLLMQGLAEQDALILENSNMWGDLQKAETHHDAVIRVARVIAKTKPYHMSRFIMGLLPPPYHPPSSTVLAFYTELLCYPELLEKSQQKLIIQMMLRAKPTGKDVEILRIRALWNVCSHIPDKVKKYKKEMQAIIKAGLHNMDPDIVLEAMKTAGKMALLLKKKGMGTLYHDALVQCQTYIDYEDPTMRCQAVQLLGELARSTKVNKRGAFSNIVEKSLLYLLYQLQDKDITIVETAASTLHSCLPFVGCDKTRMVMESEGNDLCQQETYPARVPTALRCLFPFSAVLSDILSEVSVTNLVRMNQGYLIDITGSLITERPHLISQLLREATSHLGKEPFQTQAVNLIDNIMHVCYEDDYSLIDLEDMWELYSSACIAPAHECAVRQKSW
ncbi:uncharacterized protein LOC142467499 isoform X3 [Ascaphus truei]